MTEGEGAAARGGLLRSIEHLAATLLGAARTRLEILATEIDEERLRLEQLFLLGLAAAFCTAIGIMLVVAFVVIYFWDTHRLLTVGILMLTFLAAGALLGWMLRGKVKARPKPFTATCDELSKDEASLREAQG